MAWLDDPAILAGVPLLAIGVIGAAIAILAALAPERPMAVDTGMATFHRAPGAHPTPAEYINIGIILAVITAIEVFVYYVGAIRDALVPILLILSVTKFVLVVLWFMHLRFDNRIFSTLFTGGIMLAAAIFIVVLATLGSSLR